MSEFSEAEGGFDQFLRLRAAIDVEKHAKRNTVEALQHFADFLEASKGQHFIISAIAGSRGMKQVSSSGEERWMFVRTGRLADQPVAFEPQEMVIGNVGRLFPVEGNASVELLWPGFDNQKLIVGLKNIVSIEPVTEPAFTSE